MGEEKTFTVTGNDVHISDGDHTFDELYAHRAELFLALCRIIEAEEGGIPGDAPVWRSRLHADGTMPDGWFIMGMHQEPGQQITYRLPNSEIFSALEGSHAHHQDFARSRDL